MMWIEQSKNLTGLGRTLLPTSHIISTKLNGYLKMIDVWGADHGVTRRMQAAVNAASNYEASLDVKICQIVHLLKTGNRLECRNGLVLLLRLKTF